MNGPGSPVAQGGAGGGGPPSTTVAAASGVARPLVAATAALLALAYLWSFRTYGLNVDDEGTLLYQILRVARGELPYLDFTTGYTPGFFFVSAALWRYAGALPALRGMIALVHALSIGGLALIVARVARPSLALAMPLLYLAFIPVLPGESCTFNVPYPAWFATLGWVTTAAAMLAFLRRCRRAQPGRGWLALAGLTAAATLAMKPNAGVFAIGAATATLLVCDRPDGGVGRVSAALWWLLWAGVQLGAAATFGPHLPSREALVLLGPLVAVMAALPTRARVHRAGLAQDAAALLVPFVLVSLPWLLFFLLRLGAGRFAREVLLIGSGAAELYYVPYPGLEPWALSVAVLGLGFAVAGVLVARGHLVLRTAVVGIVIALVTLATMVATVGVMPERVVWSIIWQLERAGFPCAVLTHVAGVAWVWRRRGTPGGAAPLALLLFALFMHLQLYPRADFMHLVTAIPLTVAFAAFLLERVLRWWERGLTRAGAVPSACRLGLVTALVLLAVAALRAAPGLVALTTAPRVVLPFEVAPVGVEAVHGADMRDLGAAGTQLAQVVGVGEPSLAFPAVDLLLFLIGARNPSAYAYFYPGRPDHREEAEVVDTLAAAPPAALVSLNRQFTFFEAAPSYYFLLRRFVRERYTLGGRHGRFDVLVRRDLSAVRTIPPSSPGTPATEIEAATRAEASRVAAGAVGWSADAASALLTAATVDDAAARRAALETLLESLARDPVAGLETSVAAAGLDRRRQILLLRTIRDARDPRAASYLLAAAASSDARVVAEALEAMDRTRAELVARQYLWADVEEVRVWPGHDELVTAVRRALADPGTAPRVAAWSAHLAGRLHDGETVATLRARLRASLPDAPRAAAGMASGGAATAAAAAASLAALAPAGLACELTALLARRETEIVASVPPLLLAMAEGDEPVRSEVRGCLADAITAPGPARLDAIWIAAALADPTFATALRNALGTPQAEVRRAVAWALGEMPDDSASTVALARAAGSDADDITRRLAADAMAKRDGHAARAWGHQ